MPTTVHRLRDSAVRNAGSTAGQGAPDGLPQPDPAAVVAHLRRYARVLTGNAMRADDLVHVTLFRAQVEGSLQQAVTDRRLGLFRIMHDVYVTRRGIIVREAGETRDGSDAQRLEHVSSGARIRLQVVGERLGHLTAAQREILLLVVVEKLRYEEVAAILEIPVASVISRLSRARERLTGMTDKHQSTFDIKRDRAEIEGTY